MIFQSEINCQLVRRGGKTLQQSSYTYDWNISGKNNKMQLYRVKIVLKLSIQNKCIACLWLRNKLTKTERSKHLNKII